MATVQKPTPLSFWRRLKWPAALLLLLGLLAFGAISLGKYRLHQQINQLGRALTERKLSQAAFLLNTLQSRHPDHPEVLAERARFESLTGQSVAVPSWIDVMNRVPTQAEYRVAAVLTCIQFNQFPKAEKIIQEWPQTLRQGTAFSRAALALAFARKDWETAQKHADILTKLDPTSASARLNQAIIALQGPHSEPARLTLQQMARDPNPSTQSSALRPLLQDALQRKDQKALSLLAEPLISSNNTPFESLMPSLEALQKGGIPPENSTLQQIWREKLSQPGQMSQLVGWMVTSGRGKEAWEFYTQTPPSQPWVFPLGLALTEAAVVAGQRETAWVGLSKTNWPGLEDLRALCLARLSWPNPSANTHLERAVSSATNRRQGLESLLAVVEQWRWEPGLIRILQARIQTPNPTPREFTALYALLEKQGNTEAMRLATIRQLELFPNAPVALNNAAYFSLLRGAQITQASAWAGQAVTQRPDAPAFAATLAFAQITLKDWEAARLTLDRFPDSPVLDLTRGAWWVTQNKPAPLTLRRAVEKYPTYYPEEVSLKEKILTFP